MSQENEFSGNGNGDETAAGTETSPEQKEKQTRKRLPKGAKPPVLNLKDAVSLVQAFYEEAGGEATFDLVSRLTNNSASSSVFFNKINLLRNLGLIEVENRKVTLSELGERIVAPREPKERMESLKLAFLNTDVYQNIYEKFVGKILPQDEYLINTVADFAPREFADEWMWHFKTAAQFAGLLFQREDGKFQVVEGIGVANITDEPKTNKPVVEELRVEKTPELIPQQPVIVQPEKTPFQFLIEILSPADMSAEEQQAIWTLIQYLKKKETGAV